MVLAICFTEPETGSNYILGTDFCFSTRAHQRRDGRWVLNGEKRFISNGADAGAYLVFACTDDSKPARAGTGAFLVDRGTPGFRLPRSTRRSLSGRSTMRACTSTMSSWRRTACSGIPPRATRAPGRFSRRA
jgi:alkylation response protein AidB-like acyl-CoA dehydrogenase